MRPRQVSSSPGQTIFTNRAASRRTCLGGVSAGSGGSGFFTAGLGGGALTADRAGGRLRAGFLSACFPTLGNLVTFASLRAFGFAGALATLAAALGGGRIFFAALR